MAKLSDKDPCCLETKNTLGLKICFKKCTSSIMELAKTSHAFEENKKVKNKRVFWPLKVSRD